MKNHPASPKSLFPGNRVCRFICALLFALMTSAHADVELLNVSYDPTRELYQEFNAAFARQWVAKDDWEKKLLASRSPLSLRLVVPSRRDPA